MGINMLNSFFLFDFGLSVKVSDEKLTSTADCNVGNANQHSN